MLRENFFPNLGDSNHGNEGQNSLAGAGGEVVAVDVGRRVTHELPVLVNSEIVSLKEERK